MAYHLATARFLFFLTFGCVCDTRTTSRYVVEDDQAPDNILPQMKQPVSQPQPDEVPPHDPASLQSEQPFLSLETWEFPVPEVPLPEPTGAYRPQESVPAESITAYCGDSVIRVEVNPGMLGIGYPLQPADLTLGECQAIGEDFSKQVLVFKSLLQGCGSQLRMTEEAVIYSFTLLYHPKTLNDTPMERASNAVAGIECHYPSKLKLRSNAVVPSWTPLTDNKVVNEMFDFSLELMTDDWDSERPITPYFLGDIINIEASVLQHYHVPLRVFVDSCVATLVPDIDTEPRYSFIESFGCLVDAKITGSSSRFLPRSQDGKLQFQLEAFRFEKQTSESIYITCHLKADLVTSSEVNNKACSYIDGWTAVDGNDEACACCDSSCNRRTPRDVKTTGFLLEGEATLGPIKYAEVQMGRVLKGRLMV